MIIDDLKIRLKQYQETKDLWSILLFIMIIDLIESIGKTNGNRETTDEEAKEAIKNWISNNEDMLEYLPEGSFMVTNLNLENLLLKEFLLP